MGSEAEADLEPQIAHVLLIDIVAYSRLLVNEQIAAVRLLNRIARETPTFRAADAAGKLTRLPTGDGMALIFFDSPESPARCALEMSRALQAHPEIKVRMGAHSGAISAVADVNDRANVAGIGINLAQRVMDCGDAGHILFSKQLAENLAQYRHWQPSLHPLGKVEVKHGVELELFNFYTDEIGNRETPAKLKTRPRLDGFPSSRTRMLAFASVAAAVLVLAAVAFLAEKTRGPIPPAEGEKAIAVLPFRVDAANAETVRLAAEIHDVVLNTLAEHKELTVISPGSVLDPRLTAMNVSEKAKALGVTIFLEGSLQRDGAELRASARLVEAPMGKVLRAHSFVAKADEPTRLENEIADFALAASGAGERPNDQPTPAANLAAYETFLRGRDWERKADANAADNGIKAAEAYEQALQLDPKFVRAAARLACTYARICWQASGTDLEAIYSPKAEEAIQRVLQLDANSPYARAALGFYYFYYHADYAQAEAELKRAREALPNDSEVAFGLGLVQRRRAAWENSVANLREAARLDPLNARVLAKLAETFDGLHRYDEALQTIERIEALGAATPDVQLHKAMIIFKRSGTTAELRRVLETIQSDEEFATGFARYQLYMFERKYDEGLTALQRSDEEMCYPEWGIFPKELLLGMVCLTKGDAARAHQYLEMSRQKLEAMAQPGAEARLRIALALAYAALGEKNSALQQGRLAREQRSPERDAVAGPPIAVTLAWVYVVLGEKELALGELEPLAKMPFGIAPNQLRADPCWDPLRDDARFQQLLQ